MKARRTTSPRKRTKTSGSAPNTTISASAPARERDNIYADVKADTLKKLLPIFDNLERALRQETADEAYKKGVKMTMTQFLEALQALGVTPIEAVGQKFDPNEHNAVMHMEDPEKGEGEIVQEFQKGFKMGDRVIRFSMVQVAN